MKYGRNMSYRLKETASFLSEQADHEARRNAILDCLKEKAIDFKLQENEQATNIIAGKLIPDGNTPILCAHYDVLSGSSGANDNLSSVSILIHLLQRQPGLQALFTDGEETGHTGAALFQKNWKEQFPGLQPLAVIVLDTCGVGNTETIRIRKGKFSAPFRRMMERRMKKKYHLHPLSSLPESDEKVLADLGAPTMLISMMPEDDVRQLESAGNYYGPLLSAAAEYRQMMENLEVMQTIHGGVLDKPEILQEQAMENVLNHLLETLC
ncbi:M28 family peptidase [Erysipelotrichaceae bacterium 51-3]